MAFLSVMPNLYVSDVERAATFYRDLLGGVETFRVPAEGPAEHVEVRIGDAVIALSAAAVVPDQGLPTPSPGQPLELVIWCDSAATSPATAAPTSPTPTGTGSRWSARTGRSAGSKSSVGAACPTPTHAARQGRPWQQPTAPQSSHAADDRDEPK